MRTFFIYLLLLFFIPVLFFSSCKKFVTVDSPPNLLLQKNVFASDATATAAVTGIYGQMMGPSGGFASGGTNGISLLGGLLSDELKNYAANSTATQFYQNALLPSNNTLKTFLWGEPYKYIYTANNILEELAASTGVTPAVKQQLTGEAKFIRGFWNFYLVNLFGAIPLSLSSDYQANATISQSSIPTVYSAIINDLKDAASLLSDDYSFSQGQKVRPNKWAAIALLSRVYLYNNDWAGAEEQASLIINSNKFSLPANLNTVFLANSPEAIWQLLPIIPTYNTLDGNIFILAASPTIAALNTNLLVAFEAGDQRKIDWINSYSSGATYYYSYKYKIKNANTLTEYTMVLRLAEQFLIRAEAEVQQSKFVSAASDINTIRSRAKLGPYAGTADKAGLLNAIIKERRLELFTEWGNRWFDLKRMNIVDSVMTIAAPVKNGIWKSTAQLLPLPQYDLRNNINLHQNPGY